MEVLFAPHQVIVIVIIGLSLISFALRFVFEFIPTLLDIGLILPIFPLLSIIDLSVRACPLAQAPTSVLILDGLAIYICRRVCLYAGVFPINVFYDSLICGFCGLLAHTVMLLLYLLSRITASIGTLYKTLNRVRGLNEEELEEFWQKMDEKLRREATLGTGRGELQAIQAHVGNDPDLLLDRHGAVMWRFGVAEEDLEDAVLDLDGLSDDDGCAPGMYNTRSHRHGTYRLKVKTRRLRVKAKYTLVPVDADPDGPLHLRVYDQDYQDCNICSSTLARPGYISMLPCGHVFHPACVTKWLKKKFQCPVCTQKFEWYWRLKDQKVD